MNTAKQHSIGKAIALSLLPGLAAVIAYSILAPMLIKMGYPAMFSILIVAAVVILPIELGYLLRQAKLLNGTYALKDIVLYRNPLPKWQYVLIPLGLVIWGFLATGMTPLLDNVIAKAWFFWLPEWFAIFDISQLQEYTRPALMATFILGLFVNGLILPIVEELYFRGYLLPRLERYGKWAPLIHVSLFSLYHFWTPW